MTFRLLVLLNVLTCLDAHAAGTATYGCSVKYFNAFQDPALTPLGTLFYASSGPNGCTYSHTDAAPLPAYPNSSTTVHALADSGTGLSPPAVEAQVFVTGNSLVTAYSRGLGIYEVDLVALGTTIPVPVPIFVSGHGTVSAGARSGSPAAGLDASAKLDAYARLTVARGLDDLAEKTVSVTTCAASNSGTSCDVFPNQANDRFDLFTYAILYPDTFINIISEGVVSAVTSGAADQAGSGGEAFARVDPYVWIDPTFMVEVSGEMVPANQLFKLVASPGIEFVNIPDPAYVPLPAAIWQLGAGVLLLAGRAARRRSKGGPSLAGRAALSRLELPL